MNPVPKLFDLSGRIALVTAIYAVVLAKFVPSRWCEQLHVAKPPFACGWRSCSIPAWSSLACPITSSPAAWAQST